MVARRIRPSITDDDTGPAEETPDDPRIGQVLARPGSQFVSLPDGTEYRLDPETGAAVARVQ